MKARALSVCNGILAFAMTFMAGMSAHADDTEIFFGSSVGSKPNVLFILDTSGSMSGKDGGATSRMDRMKSAFNSLIDGINNTNVGLMRFNDPGGPLLYPVSNIDAPVTVLTNVVGTISANGDDAEQAASGAVNLTNESLAMTTRSTSTGNTVSVRVSTGNRDAEQRVSSGTMYQNNGALDLNYDAATVAAANASIVGLIFQNVGIPRNAVIMDAYVTFTVQSDTGAARSNPLNMEIRGQLATAASDFSTAANNISSRTKTTASKIWNITDTTPALETVDTPNIAPVIQELVNQSGWSTSGATNHVALFLSRPSADTTTGVRSFYSYNQSSARAPLLTVVYEIPVTPTVQTVGLRYTDITIPRGAKITTASLEFVSVSDSSTAATYTIRGHDVGNSPAFSSSSNNLSSRTQTTATVSWTPDAWVANELYSTLDNAADLKDVIQAIINRSDWCGGNALSLIIQGSGTRIAKSYDSSPSLAPKLRIAYDPTDIASGGGCMNGSASYRVGNGDDDASVNIGGNGQDLANGTLYLGNDANSANALGIRFTNIQIPKDANIVSAYLEFTARSTDSTSIPLNIRMQLADNPTIFEDNNKVTNAARSYSSTVAWTPGNWTTDVTYLSPDLSTLVQQIVNRSGWDKGNAMVFELRRSGTATGRRRAYSYNASTSRAPRLIINYTSNVSAASNQTTRHVLKSLVSEMVPAGYTPIVDMLYEAALYYRGENVHWGRIRGDAATMRSTANDRRYFRLSHPDSYTGGTVVLPTGCDPSNLNSTNCVNSYIDGSPIYKSPIVDECQANHIVFLTDGAPTQNRSAALIRAMTGKTSCSQTSYSACANEIAEFLYTQDQSSLPGDTQKVMTHTVAFNLDDSSGFLSGIAKSGGTTQTRSANSAEELLDVFKEIFASIADATDTTFVSPGVTVNAFNRLTHRDEIYFALFRPERTPHWPGNLKRYRIDSSGTIFDSKGEDAIDPKKGFFKETARSWWSSYNDGNSAEEGGSADRLTNYTTRKMYTYYSGSPSTNLANAANNFIASNTNITKDMLGNDLMTDEMRTNLIEWARGRDTKDVNGNDSTTDERKRMSDPLHSVPHLVTYGGTDADPDITIFYGDNEGFLHAINGKTGDAYFSFIPQELLPNLLKLYDNSTATKHPYGLDSPPNAWVKDVNNDLIITPSEGDRVYVYVGMGRGGRNYYAIDATDRDSPKILWTIRGGNGDFSELGQTWARPIKTQINVNGTVTDVLILSGGYDPNQDNVTVRTADNMGRAIFIVNAITGQKIWSAGPTAAHNLQLTDMRFGIPSTIRAVDINNDKLADQLYVGDMGGQLWRFDINNGNAVASLATGAVIADIAGNTAASARRFYHEPDVSLLIENNTRKLAVAIGSGYRGHPLNDTIEDRFYLFKLTDVGGPPTDGPDAGTYPDYVKLTESNLYDATDNLIGQGTDEEKQTAIDALKAASGWFIQMENEGEKVLSSATTFAGEVFFTTYSPRASTTGCTLGNGTSRRYRVNAVDATPARNAEDMQDGTTLTKDDRSEELLTTGIAADPQILRLEGGNVVCVGTECEALGSTDAITKTYWYSE